MEILVRHFGKACRAVAIKDECESMPEIFPRPIFSDFLRYEVYWDEIIADHIQVEDICEDMHAEQS